MTIDDILKQYWSYDRFRPMQEEIITSVLEGKDTLALLPTGGGKSICFQVAALACEGICIVVSPLIALMKDQVENLLAKGIPAAAIYTGLHKREIDLTLSRCLKGDFKFLYLSPERLKGTLLRNTVQQMKVNLLAVDEAHCISQWGYDFRPPYLEIAAFRDILQGPVPVLALTATATTEVVTDIQEKLNFREKNVFRESFVRENLIYYVFNEQDKNKRMLNIMSKVPGTGIVYVRNRKKTAEVAEFLVRNKISADFYHAGLDIKTREQKQEAWKLGKTRVIVATNAFGMGIDKPDVRFVIHLDIPDNLEAYFQEAGRAGRDGNTAHAILLYEQSDLLTLETNFEQSFPPLEEIKKVYESLCVYFRIPIGEGENLSFDFDLFSFCNQYRLKPMVVHNALVLLERTGWIAITDPLKNTSKVNFVYDSNELYKFQVANQRYDDFIKLMLRSYQGLFTSFVSIREEELAQRMHITEEKVLVFLSELDKLGVLYYDRQTSKPKIIMLCNRVEKKHVFLEQSVFIDRKRTAKNRLEAVYNYVKTTTKCRSRLLLDYFGQKSDVSCQRCDVCLRKKREENLKKLNEKVKAAIVALLREKNYLYKELLADLPFSQELVGENLRYLLAKELVVMTEEQKYTLKKNI